MIVSQDLFVTALLDPAQPRPEGLQDAQTRPAGRRFDVYRNNVAVSLTEALHTAFPATAKLLGKANMDRLSAVFLRANPPSSPLLMFYGEGFADFLAGIPDLAKMGYLPDLARLDLAQRHAYHAADGAGLAAETLGEIAPEALMQMRVTLAPAVTVLRSDWPLYDIWRIATQDNAPQPGAQKQDILITRPDFDPVLQPLPAGGADWIAALQNGASIGDAYEHALGKEPGFDLGATLTLLLQGDAITSLTAN